MWKDLIIDMLDNMLYDNFNYNNDFATVITILGIISIIVSLVLFIIYYVVPRYATMCIGRKAGLKEDWMPFIPIANTIYCLKIMNEPWWKLFFFNANNFGLIKVSICYYIAMIIAIITQAGLPVLFIICALNFIFIDATGFAVAILLGTLFYLIFSFSTSASIVVGIIVFIAFLAFATICTLNYKYKYYEAVNFNPKFAAISLLPIGSIILTVTDYIIAFSNKHSFVGIEEAMDSSICEESYNKPTSIVSSGAIIGISGMYKDQNFEIKNGEELIFGRDSAIAHIIIDVNAEKVSRKHCSIRYDGILSNYSVTDYSSNGTYTDSGTRIAANLATTLPKGTLISLGNNKNQFKLN